MKYLARQRYPRNTGFHDSLDPSPDAAIFYSPHTRKRIARRVDKELAEFMYLAREASEPHQMSPIFLSYKNALR